MVLDIQQLVWIQVSGIVELQRPIASFSHAAS